MLRRAGLPGGAHEVDRSDQRLNPAPKAGSAESDLLGLPLAGDRDGVLNDADHGPKGRRSRMWISTLMKTVHLAVVVRAGRGPQWVVVSGPPAGA